MWHSSDGSNWSQASMPPFSPRVGHGMVVFENKMWVIGGQNSGGTFADIWVTTDGNNWKQLTDNVDFGKRSYHAVTVHNNKIWVCAGLDSTSNYSFSDIWYLK